MNNSKWLKNAQIYVDLCVEALSQHPLRDVELLHWTSKLSQQKDKYPFDLDSLLTSFFTSDNQHIIEANLKRVYNSPDREEQGVVQLYQCMFSPPSKSVKPEKGLSRLGTLVNNGCIRNALFYPALPALLQWEEMWFYSTANDKRLPGAVLGCVEVAWDYTIAGYTYDGRGENMTANVARWLGGLLEAHEKNPQVVTEDRLEKVVYEFYKGIQSKHGLHDSCIYGVPVLVETLMKIQDGLTSPDLKQSSQPYCWLSEILPKTNLDVNEVLRWNEEPQRYIWEELFQRDDLKKFDNSWWALKMCKTTNIENLPVFREHFKSAPSAWVKAFEKECAHRSYENKAVKVSDTNHDVQAGWLVGEEMQNLYANLQKFPSIPSSDFENINWTKAFTELSAEKNYQTYAMLSMFLEKADKELNSDVSSELFEKIFNMQDWMAEMIEDNENKERKCSPTMNAFFRTMEKLIEKSAVVFSENPGEDLAHRLRYYKQVTIPTSLFTVMSQRDDLNESAFIAEAAQTDIRFQPLLNALLQDKIVPSSSPKSNVVVPRF